MSEKRIALVTGGNRGIGLEICRQLSQKGIAVILTARDKEKGISATANLNREGLDISFYPLDVTSDEHVKQVKTYIENEYGQLDILINNAAIFLDESKSVFDTPVNTIAETLETNVYGPLRLCQHLIPLMVKNNYGRIVNISSELGSLSSMSGGSVGYRISKTALNAVTRILSAEVKDKNIIINSMCPGWVKTDMGGSHAPGTVAEGADTAIYLSTLPDKSPSGLFYQNRKPISW